MKKTMVMKARLQMPNGAKMDQYIAPQYHKLSPGVKVIFAGGKEPYTILATAPLEPLTRDMLCWTVVEVVE